MLKDLDVLEYREDFYEGAHPNSSIISRAIGAYTNGESQALAALCCVDPWELWNHRIHKVCSQEALLELELDYQTLGSDPIREVWAKLEKLAADHRIQLWFSPNG